MITQKSQLPLLLGLSLSVGSIHAPQAQTSQFFTHGVLSELFSPLGFAASSSFIPLPPSLLL